MKLWVIRHVTSLLYWSNKMGWVDDIRLAETFTSAQTNECSLPMEGEWKARES